LKKQTEKKTKKIEHALLVLIEIILQDYTNASFVKNLFILSAVLFQHQIVMKDMNRKEYVRTVMEKFGEGGK
jgi:hypothetical protein